MKDERAKQINITLAFLRSVILSGDPMTEEVRNAINEAQENIHNIDLDIQSFQSSSIH
jgi:hypothetical protein